jgi:hypothetical protein
MHTWLSEAIWIFKKRDATYYKNYAKLGSRLNEY